MYLKLEQYGGQDFPVFLVYDKYEKNYSYTNLKYMKQFYLLFPILRTVCEELTWTHYRYLLPIKSENERNYYINQVILNNLSVR